jgi:hypothetical protein
MDYCKICKTKTKSTGKPEFIVKYKRWRRISTCRICQSVKNNISKSPKDILIFELFKPSRKKYPTRRFQHRGIDDTWQIDIYVFYRPKGKSEDPSYTLRSKTLKSKESKTKPNDFNKFKKINKGFIYILVAEDTFSKFVWVEPLKTKSGLEVANAFLKIIQQAIKDKHNPPKNLHADRGKEFYNKNMRIVLNKYNINLYSTGTKNKAFFVERFNYTLGNKFKPILYDSFDWLSLLPKIIKSYNNSYHTTIKMKPKDVNKENERQLLETVYMITLTNKKAKFEVGDRIRLSTMVDIFRNKLKTNWTEEIFTVVEKRVYNVWIYFVSDLNGEKIKEGIYEAEMQLTLL